MRNIGRNRREEFDEDSVFVPMTDMTVSFLFIVMILLAFFAVQFSDEDNVPRSVYDVVFQEREELKVQVEKLKLEVKKLNELINQLREENAQLQEKNKKLNIENSNLTRELSDALNLIDDLQAKVKNLVKKNLELNRLVVTLKEEIAEIRELLKQRDARIIALEQDLELLKLQELKLKTEISDLEKTILKLEAEIIWLVEFLDEKDEIIEARNRLIKTLKQTLDTLLEQAEKRDQQILELKEELELLKLRLKDDPLEAFLFESQLKRTKILFEIERKLKIEFPDILVEVSPENDALRFKGDGLFLSGSSELSPSKRKIIEKVGALIVDSIECYTINPKAPNYRSCNPDGILIEAIQIEGHTDNSRFIGADGRDLNVELSAKRAESAFFAMKNKQPDLLAYENLKGQPVISIAGYGSMRPVNTNPLMKAENRRIDLRLIMFTPTNRDQVNIIQKRIEDELEIMLEEVE